MLDNTKRENEITTANSTYKKLAVQWLNEALCFVSSSVLADSFRLRNRQLLVAAKRWWQLLRLVDSVVQLDKFEFFKKINNKNEITCNAGHLSKIQPLRL